MPSLLRIGLCAPALAILVSTSALIAQTQDRAIGTWKLNLAKSNYAPGPPPASLTVTLEVAGRGLRVTSRGEEADGRPIHIEFVANLDGKNYPVTGARDYDTVVLRRIDASTIESQRKRIGLVVQRVRLAVSKDGKVLTTVTTGSEASGRKIKNVAVFDRQ
jgi:hypothetical protein